MSRFVRTLALPIAGIVTAAGLLAASFFPAVRVWGFSEWAYLGIGYRLALAAGLAVASVIAFRRASSSPDAPSDSARVRGAISWPVSLSVAVLSGIVFYLFRTQTHFLGDGYLLLNSLASDNPLLRLRNYGEMLVHIWIKDLLPWKPEAAALAAFRIVSIGAGMVHTVLVLRVAPKLVEGRRQSWLFALGMMTGGYALLYFGYVENYSLFGLSVALFTYTGILIATRRIARWWILPCLVLAVFFHALGLTLVPATAYLLLAQTAMARRWGGMKRAAQIAVATGIVLVLALPALLIVRDSEFLRFALVPFAGSFLCLEGYSMFSLPHVLDLVNLVFLLVPAALILGVALSRSDLREVCREPRFRFLFVATASVTLAAFVFEAKLGMPRDWDLFSFVGYPWLALLLLIVLTSRQDRVAARAVLLAIVIACACLIPRVITAHSPSRGIQQFRDYANIDIRKNRSGWYVLGQYYLNAGDTVAYKSIRDLRKRRFPEEIITASAEIAFRQQQYDSALVLCKRALSLNSAYAAAWANLGGCYVAIGRYDSAITDLKRALALNPNVAVVESQLGLAYILANRLDDAEHMFLQAHHSDTSLFEPIMSLARLYQRRGDDSDYVRWLATAVFRPEADGIWALELGDVYLRQRDLSRAAGAYREALRKGVDTATVASRLEANPGLRLYMRP